MRKSRLFIMFIVAALFLVAATFTLNLVVGDDFTINCSDGQLTITSQTSSSLAGICETPPPPTPTPTPSAFETPPAVTTINLVANPRFGSGTGDCNGDGWTQVSGNWSFTWEPVVAPPWSECTAKTYTIGVLKQSITVGQPHSVIEFYSGEAHHEVGEMVRYIYGISGTYTTLVFSTSNRVPDIRTLPNKMKGAEDWEYLRQDYNDPATALWIIPVPWPGYETYELWYSREDCLPGAGSCTMHGWRFADMHIGVK